MIRLRHKFLIRALRLTDQFALAIALVLVLWPEVLLADTGGLAKCLQNGGFTGAAGMLVLMTGWVFIHDHFVRYRVDRFVPFAAELRDFMKATGVACLWLLLIGLLVPYADLDSSSLAVFFGLVSVAGSTSRMIVRSVVMGARKSGYNFRNILFVGVNEHHEGGIED